MHINRFLAGCCAALLCFSLPVAALAKQPLRILTWEGYVTQEELREVNLILQQKGYDYQAVLVEPHAQGAEQMFSQIRTHKVDITFLTLFFIRMESEQTAKFLQPINITSPRLSNYADLLPGLTHLSMGLNTAGEPLYIPWGGGIYGFYIDRDKVDAEQVPRSVKDLWLPRWSNKFSLNKSQEWYNIGLSLMSLNQSPFYIYHLAQMRNRREMRASIDPKGELQQQLSKLYVNAGDFWEASPEFSADLSIVSSWGPEIARENKKGNNWQLIQFKEGHMAWLDTINFVKGLDGKKLQAAEVFANYFIGKKVQNRITKQLSMVAAHSKVAANKDLGNPRDIFQAHMFVPPYDKMTYNAMKKMADQARKDVLESRK
ncbi:MAG: PotD/PotF family extracellular solute-binding protein [Pseudomonadales bacterium]|nr:PotD/PotF family extracellular solute-binding protein [Pseudomonadales bacterium]NRA17032.1 extracellular solute-binding protein [Oceanospirillaceae bacterium]